MISCSGLTKAYGAQTVFRGLNFDFPDTGLLLLLGESGSGKTTFLNILSGMIPFDEGSVCVDGQAYHGQVDAAALAARIDYLTQDSCFADFLNVTDNLRLVRDDPEEIARLLKQYGLSRTAEQLPPTLSGGEKQRLAILRAILGGKDVLLLDEPTAALDGENKLAVLELLSSLKAQVLIVCATHDRQAIPYADQTITFHKNSMVSISAPKPGAFSSAAPAIRKEKPVLQRTNPDVFLKKWFRSKYRSRRSAVLFCVFLVLAISLCTFADTPSRKLDATLSGLYRINLTAVYTCGDGDVWELLKDPAVCFSMLDYGGSCPDGNEDLPPDVLLRPAPDYVMDLHVLPADQSVFPMADHLRYGTWFQSWDEILLSQEMAEALAPESPESLLGQTIPVKVYGLGTVRFRIVGVLDGFTSFEKQYLSKLGIMIQDGSDYNPEDYHDLYFVSSCLTDMLIGDPDFRAGSNGQRCWKLFFRSYAEAKDFYARWHDGAARGSDVFLQDPSAFGDADDLFLFLFAVAMPLALLMALFSTLFYLALRKLEFLQSARFVAVFEYAGYEKKQVIRRFIRLNLLQLGKCLAISTCIALVLTAGLNLLNRALCLVPIQLFSYNPLLLAGFLSLILLVAWWSVTVSYRKLNIQSWYEILVSRRDLL